MRGQHWAAPKGALALNSLAPDSLAFDDVLIRPKFSTVRSRADVDLTSDFLGLNLALPIISANMDTITEENMAVAMNLAGGIGCLHRFCSIPRNIEMFLNTVTLTQSSLLYRDGMNVKPMVSIGLGEGEIERAMALKSTGATHFVIDIAHGASIGCVEQYDRLREELGDEVYIIVGNFADAAGIDGFLDASVSSSPPDCFKVGVGGGGVCTTRITTGCGMPTLASGLSVGRNSVSYILDGGIRNSGDIAKALAVGAGAVMVGSLLAGTDQTPGEVIDGFKKYRGSASKESYEVQGKTASHRAPEGESTLIPCKGNAIAVLEELGGGVRSAFAYVGAINLEEFQAEAELVQVSNNSVAENKPHSKR